MQRLLLVGLILLVACGRSDTGNTLPNASNPSHDVSADDDACRRYVGNWEIRTYKGATTESEILCDGSPCDGGNWEGYLRISCPDKKLLGTIILGYSSLPAPGREATASLDFSITDSRITISYFDQRQCKTSYDVGRNDGLLIGKFSSKGCKYKASYETDAEFAEGTTGSVVLVRN